MNARAARGAQSRVEILEAAAAAIARDGYFGMTMRDLARATGKGLATFYSHFESKEDVLFELQRDAFDTLIRSASEAVTQAPDAATQLYLFISSHVHYVLEHRDVMRVLVHEAGALPPQRRKKIRKLKEAYFAVARDVLQALAREGCGAPAASALGEVADAELELATYNLFGMLNWIYSWHHAPTHGSAADVARSVHRLTLCGLVARCPDRRALLRAETLSTSLHRPPPLRPPQGGDL
ncbi:MAG: TetR family transcriptional regulator [Polyangiaceae bacterium]|nr:TetR family transcriptional regulator [Polyangiaceae bacterium]